MIEKKSLVKTIKRALQTGGLNLVGQDLTQVPADLFRIEDLPMEDTNWWECVAITKMDFSNNQITSIPPNITVFPDLQLIRFKNNKLQSLPETLTELATLKLLDCCSNQIAELPPNYALFPALVELDLAQNRLMQLPSLSKITTLEVLNLNDNRLKALPLLGPNLKKVEASSNSISELSADVFSQCGQLQTLTLNKNCIERIEKGTFAKTRSLIVVELKENKLLEFSEMPHSQKLDTLALSFNRLREFNDFNRAPNLTVLILNDNKIEKISGQVLTLRRIKTLDVSNNNLSDLPSELGMIESLVRLQIEGNPMRAIRQNIRAGGVGQIKKYLRDRMDGGKREALETKIAPSHSMTQHQQWTRLIQEFMMNGELVLRNMKLEALSPIVFEKELRVLNLTQNSLSHIPEQIEQAHTLKSVVLNHNKLAALPARLARLPALESIQAQHNQLTDFIPPQHHFLPSLVHLDLSGNKISSVPKSILMIPKLRTLLLSYNRISSLQQLWGVEVLPWLQILDVSNNQLSDVSEGVWNKQKLNYFNIENNNIGKLPTILGFMPLLGLKVDGNPLKLIKRTVIDKGTVALLDFLRNKHQGDPPVRTHHLPQQPQKPSFEEQFEFPRRQPPPQRPSQQSMPMGGRGNQEVARNHAQEEQEKRVQVATLEKEIAAIERELEDNMSMNNMQRNQRRKRKQALMIERNKLLRK